MAEAGARLAIRLLQDAAERGEIDPWDVDVIAVVDGFLDQLRQRIGAPRLVGRPGDGGSYESDLAATSEAFLAASVLVSLKAEILEQQTLPPNRSWNRMASPATMTRGKSSSCSPFSCRAGPSGICCAGPWLHLPCSVPSPWAN